ncbi:MAG: hypothetical protein AAF553_00420 [Pseudomonadota bacterium]
MKTLNKIELENVAGGVPFLALPLAVVVLPRPTPKPSNEPVPSQTAE